MEAQTENNTEGQGQPKMVELVLLDFDGTLTTQHSGGALWFHRYDSRQCLLVNEEGNEEMTRFGTNVASKDPAFTLRLLLDLVFVKKVCVAIATMSDSSIHNKLREDERQQSTKTDFMVIGGREMVLHWIYCLAMEALPKDQREGARGIVDALVHSGRFLVIAKFHPSTKRYHLDEALRYFAPRLSRSALSSAYPFEHVLYIDDTLFLLKDMKEKAPGINVAWLPHGINAENWTEKVCSKYIL